MKLLESESKIPSPKIPSNTHFMALIAVLTSGDTFNTTGKLSSLKKHAYLFMEYDPEREGTNASNSLHATSDEMLKQTLPSASKSFTLYVGYNTNQHILD